MPKPLKELVDELLQADPAVDSVDETEPSGPPKPPAAAPDAFQAEMAKASATAKQTRKDAELWQNLDDFASAMSMGSYKGRDRRGPMLEEAQRIEQEPIAKRKQAGLVADLGDKEADRDKTSWRSRTARDTLAAMAPGIRARMGASFDELTAGQITSMAPLIKEHLDAEAKKLTLEEQSRKEAASAASLRDVLGRQFPEETKGLPIDTYSLKALEDLTRRLQSEKLQKTGQTFTREENEKRNATTIQAAGLPASAAATAKRAEEVGKWQALAGPAGLIPQAGRKPTEADSGKIGDAWRYKESASGAISRLAELHAQHGAAGLVQDPALRAQAESLVTQIQLAAKGNSDLQLGVLAGPDMSILTGLFPPTATAGQALAELIGQGTAGPKLEEALKRSQNIWRLAKEQFGYAERGDEGYDASKKAYTERTTERPELVPVYEVATGRMSMRPPDIARRLASDPSRFSLTRPKR